MALNSFILGNLIYNNISVNVEENCSTAVFFILLKVQIQIYKKSSQERMHHREIENSAFLKRIRA